MANLDDLRIDSAVPRPRRIRRWSPWRLLAILGLLAAAGWSLAGYLGGTMTTNLPAKLLGRLVPKAEVQILTVPAAGNGPSGALTAGGYLEVIPPGPRIVSSLVAGQVQAIHVVPGQPVAAGQVVAQLDSSLYLRQASVLAARVELAKRELARQTAGFRSQEIDSAQAMLDSANAQLARAEADYQRHEELFSAGIVSRMDYDAAVATVEQARAAVAAQQATLSLHQSGTRPEDLEISRAAVAATEAEFAQVQYQISKCTLTSPVSGVVYELMVQPGDWLSPASGDLQAGAVLSVIDPLMVQAWVDVNQRDSASVYVGQDVSLSSDADPQNPVAGRVLGVMPKANLQKNTIEVKVQIAEPPAGFRPGLAVKAVFHQDEQAPHSPLPSEPAVQLPAAALMSDERGTGVLIVVDERASWQEVSAADVGGDLVEITQGLKPGDRVIVNPAGLKEGQAVAVSQSAQEENN